MKSDTGSSSWTPTRLWEPLQIWTVGLSIVKTAISPVICNLSLPYCGLANLGTCADIILISFVISIPFGIFRSKRMQMLAYLCADLVFACCIFTGAGLMAGALAVLLLLTTTTFLGYVYSNLRQKLSVVPIKGKLQYYGYLLVWGLLALLL